MWFCSQERTKSMCFIFTKFYKIILPDRQKSIFLKTKDFQVKYILDGAFILLIKNALGFTATNFIWTPKRCQ